MSRVLWRRWFMTVSVVGNDTISLESLTVPKATLIPPLLLLVCKMVRVPISFLYLFRSSEVVRISLPSSVWEFLCLIELIADISWRRVRSSSLVIPLGLGGWSRASKASFYLHWFLIRSYQSETLNCIGRYARNWKNMKYYFILNFTLLIFYDQGN